VSSSESPRRQDQYGRPVSGSSQTPAHLEAVQVRHQHIQNHRVELRLPQPLQRRKTVSRGRDMVALKFECSLNSVAHVRIVVHDQHAPATTVSRLHQRLFIAGLHA
jgi:hypothetical protein